MLNFIVLSFSCSLACICSIGFPFFCPVLTKHGCWLGLPERAAYHNYNVQAVYSSSHIPPSVHRCRAPVLACFSHLYNKAPNATISKGNACMYQVLSLLQLPDLISSPVVDPLKHVCGISVVIYQVSPLLVHCFYRI